MRVADYIISFIYNVGVKYIFMVSGGVAMHLNDAVAIHKKIKYICNHHEQASVMAADSYARITGNFGAAMVTAGPGSTNTLTGLLNAWQDSTPCMIISGQSKKKETIQDSKIPSLRQFGVFEVNIVPIVKSVTKFSIMLTEPEKVRYYLEKGLYIAKSGRPGPVWIDVPLDVQGAIINPKKLSSFNPAELRPSDSQGENFQSQLKKVLQLLKSSRKPVIIAGHGIRLSNAVDDFLSLVQKLRVPVVTSIMGTDVIESNNPFYVGRAGLKGERAANITLQNADLILSIGSRLSIQLIGYEYAKFAPKAKKVVVDIDEIEHRKKTITIDELIFSDAKKFIRSLANKVHHNSFNFKPGWAIKCKDLARRYQVCLPEYAKLKGAMNMYYVVDKISDNLNKDDIIVTDAGFSYYIVRQAFKIKQGQRLIIPGATGMLGFNLPGSVGASIANNKKRVICITGDGSFQTNIHDLQTIVKHKLPVKIFVIENKGYLSIRTTQSKFFQNRLIGESEKTGVSFPELSKIAYAYGIKFFRARNNRELIKLIPKALKYKGPVIFGANCLAHQEVLPLVSSKKLPDGRMISTSIDDMYPFLPDEDMNKIRADLQ